MCRQHADKEGWEFSEHLVYIDAAELSGSGADRPMGTRGYFQAAINRKHRPKLFDVLLVDDTSRLTRNRGDLEFELIADEARFLKFNEIRVVAVSQGIDTQNEQSDVLMTVHGLVDSLYIEELAKQDPPWSARASFKGPSALVDVAMDL